MLFFFAIFLSIVPAFGREHHFSMAGDMRPEFDLTTFGFTSPGFLFVNISNLKFSTSLNETGVIGFTLDRTDSAGIAPYIENRQDDQCILQESSGKTSAFKSDVVAMVLNFTELSLHLTRHGEKIAELSFYESLEDLFNNHSMEFRPKSTAPMVPPKFVIRDDILSAENTTNSSIGQIRKFDYNPKKLDRVPVSKTKSSDGEITYSFKFVMYVANKTQSGLYNLFFHNCENIKSPSIGVSFDVIIIEKNGGNFLTAFEIYLPTIYLAFSTIYFCCCIVWMMVLRKGENGSVQKIHYLMLLLVAVKSLSLFVHSVDYHFINITGQSHNTWAVLYYITYVIRGLLFFTVLVLIGSGWQLMKHVFSTNEKRLFVLVISLQVVTNIAYVLKENTEEGAQKHELWQQIFILVDLVCCGAVLFPIVWSIRHLQEATKVDGKGTANLVKLRLFRRFYITIVCYIYFTRIVVYLLRILVNFQYRWLDAVSTEAATLAFFIFTAYTFHPDLQNPYIRLSQQEEDSDSEDQIKLRNMGSNSVEHGNEVAEIVSEGDRESPREPGSPNPNWSANIRRKLNNPMSPKQSNMQKTIV